MKKILTNFLIFGVILSNMVPVFTQANYSEYLPQVQSAIVQMSPEEQITLQEKITTAISGTDNTEMIEFLENIEIMLVTQEMDDILQSILIDVEGEDIMEIPVYAELTSPQQRKVEYEISKLQSDLKDETHAMGDQIIASWNSLSRYSETGNLSAALDMNIEDILSLTAGMNISDYFAENQNFDSAISADIEGFYNIDSLFDENIELTGKTKLEFIQKGADSYLIMRNTQLSSNNESLEIELSPMIEKLTELAQDNTYISFADENSLDPLEIFGYFSNENIEREIENIFSQNLMQAYGKNENGYLLEPTKHFCDIGKNLMSVFDPFNGKDCSESQYKNMLEDFRDSGVQITLNIENDMTLTISNMAAVDENEITHIELIWRNASFREMNMNIKDRSDEREYFNLQYIADNMLSVQVPKQEYDPEFYMDIKFKKNGGIKNIDMRSSYKDEFIFTGSYNNGSLFTELDINIPEFIARCNAGGNAYASYLSVTAGCDISSSLIDTSSQSMRIDSTIMYDGQTSNNDFSWVVDALGDENNYMSLQIESEANRQVTGAYEIPTPTNTIQYIDFLKEVTPEDSYYYDDYEFEDDYEYEYNSYEDYDEACYLYESGDRECYKYYDDRDITCTYTVETDEEICETYEYGYIIEESSFEDFDRVCYNYDSGDRNCYDYYDDKDITCIYLIETDEETCETYQYDDYYDDEYDIEDTQEAME